MIVLNDITSLVSENLIRLIGAVLILLMGLLISRFISKFIYKVLNKLKLNVLSQKGLGLNIPLEEFISISVRYLLYIASIMYALNSLGITTFVLKFILAFILILLIILVLLSLKDIVPNLVAGLFLHHKNLIKLGDKIRVKDIKGKVLEITSTETKIQTKSKDVVIIPNSVLIKNEVLKEK